MSPIKNIPAKAVSDLLVLEVTIGVWRDFIALLSELLGLIRDLFDFLSPEE